MLHSQRTSLKVAAAVLGVLAIGAPIVLFNGWLRRQGDDEASIAAARALAAVEAQLGETVAMLDDLSARGVDSCLPAHREAMRQAALRTGSVKDVMLVGPGGQALCGDNGGVRYELLRTSSTASADIVLDALRSAEPAVHYLRVRKKGASGKPGIAALLSASTLVPKAWLPGSGTAGNLQVTLPGGMPVDGTKLAQAPQGTPEGSSQHSLRSKQYAVTVVATMPRQGVVASHDDLRRIGMVGTGVIALIMLLMALLLSRRKADASMGDIAKAILANEFEPYYQPVVDIQSGRLLGAEVLVRWKRSDGSVVEPSAFISLMETSGLMPEMTRALMQRVRQEIGAALGVRPAMTVAFNVAPQHFDDALILNDVGTIFNGSPVKLSQIVLELSELREVENLGSTRRTIAALQGLGCKVAIDDAGAGHNGLSYVLKLGVDIIKIDKSSIEAIETDGHSRSITDTLIDLAKNMRMEIVAEGVETFDQVTDLRERGINAAQGFVFAPPLQAGSFLKLLDAMDPPAGASNDAGRLPASVKSPAKSAAA